MIFEQNFETDPNWKVYAQPYNTTTWIARNWTFGAMPLKNSSKGYLGPDPHYTDCNSTQSGLIHLESPSIKFTSAGTVYIEIEHFMDTQINYDGGILETSVNGGAFTYLTNANAVINGYPSTPLINTTNPLSGYITYSGGFSRPNLLPTWGISIFSLDVKESDEVIIRFTFGTDPCGGTSSGWAIDSFKVYSCSAKGAPSNDKLSNGAIAGIVVGCVAFVGIAGLIVFIIIRRKANAAERKPLIPT